MTLGQKIDELLAIARDIVANSTHPDATDFDVDGWFVGWLRREQFSLGWQCPLDLILTDDGYKVVRKLLGAQESGVFL